MKTTYFISIIALLINSACLSPREKTRWFGKQQSAGYAEENIRYGYTTHSRDSSGRIRYFWSDRAFAYRQDSGLLAQSGYLWVEESQQGTKQEMQQITQKNSWSNEELTAISSQRKKRTGPSIYQWGALFIFLAGILFIVRYLRRKGSFR